MDILQEAHRRCGPARRLFLAEIDNDPILSQQLAFELDKHETINRNCASYILKHEDKGTDQQFTVTKDTTGRDLMKYAPDIRAVIKQCSPEMLVRIFDYGCFSMLTYDVMDPWLVGLVLVERPYKLNSKVSLEYLGQCINRIPADKLPNTIDHPIFQQAEHVAGKEVLAIVVAEVKRRQLLHVAFSPIPLTSTIALFQPVHFRIVFGRLNPIVYDYVDFNRRHFNNYPTAIKTMIETVLLMARFRYQQFSMPKDVIVNLLLPFLFRAASQWMTQKMQEAQIALNAFKFPAGWSRTAKDKIKVLLLDEFIPYLKIFNRHNTEFRLREYEDELKLNQLLLGLAKIGYKTEITKEQWMAGEQGPEVMARWASIQQRGHSSAVISQLREVIYNNKLRCSLIRTGVIELDDRCRIKDMATAVELSRAATKPQFQRVSKKSKPN